MLDLTKPVWFYDDRSKDDDVLELKAVLWQNGVYVLCQIIIRQYDESSVGPPFDFSTWSTREHTEPILIKLDDGRVCNSDYDSWYATNDMSWWRPFGWIAA